MVVTSLQVPHDPNTPYDMTALVRRVYYAMGSEGDEWIGRLLAALATRSDRQAWYTIYLSDHGENQMEHRQTGAPML